MVQWCVMVKGPCRGKMCDFWARVKIEKMPIEEMIANLQASISKCNTGDDATIEDALSTYWNDLGIKSMDRLCREEPDLYKKVKEAEAQTRALLLTGIH